MKILKKLGIVLVILAALIYFVGIPYGKSQTKKHSPEQTSTFKDKGMDLKVHYSAPSKKDRVIFGELVPFDNVWRTGANEPTIFSTTTDITIMDKHLPPGDYSLWTKPGSDNWEVIFNNNIPGWGVTIRSGGSETSRIPAHDVVNVSVPVQSISEVQEQLNIGFEDDGQVSMVLSWDQTKIAVPMKAQ